MTKTMIAVRVCLSAACALLAMGPVPAAAQMATTRDPSPASWLYVTVTRGEGASGHTRGTLLVCDPPQGRAYVVRACEDLRATDGDITRIPPQDAFCPMVHAPVTASARGRWHGRLVGYTKTFTNSCAMAAQTGSVFMMSDRAGSASRS